MFAIFFSVCKKSICNKKNKTNVTVQIFNFFFSLFNVHQRAFPIERNAICMNECMRECFDKSRGFSIF